jgi:hypothetical protein
MRRAIIALSAATVTAVAGMTAAVLVPAGAQAQDHPVTVTAVTVMTGRPDSGGNGNWAADDIERQLVIHQQGQPSGGIYTFTAKLSDTGEFVTDPGAFTPNQGGKNAGLKIAEVTDGDLKGGASYSFTASALPQASLVPAALSGPGPDTSTWYELAFPAGTTFGGTGIEDGWSWTYTAPSCLSVVKGQIKVVKQKWTDAASTDSGQSASAGNITGC